MIWESQYWKEDLHRIAARLRRRLDQRRWSERSFARLEKELMLGFYAVRKLHDAHKFSDEIAQRPIQAERFRWNGHPITFMGAHKFDRSYDLDSPEKCDLSLRFLSNQLVHSFVFCPVTDERGGLLGVMVNSDRTRHEALYSVQMKPIIAVFEEISINHPGTMSMTLNPATGDYDVQVGPTLENPKLG
jgi:hypothetical protein